MDVWNIVAILGGVSVVLILISFLLKYLGVGEFLGHILSIISTFFQSVFSALQSMVQAAPKPIRIAIFAVLFILLGTVIYNSTIGLTRVCYKKDVYEIDFLSGMALIMLPDSLSKAVYVPFEGLPQSDGLPGGPITTDSEGNPSIMVPEYYADNTYSKLSLSSSEGIGDKSIFFDFSLSYDICKTKSKMCYLSDIYRTMSRCTIKDDNDNVLVKGGPIYKIYIEFEKENINSETGGLKYTVVPQVYNFASAIYSFGIIRIPESLAFSLDDCEFGVDYDYEWLYTNTTGNEFELNLTDADYGSGIVYNSKKWEIIKAEVDTKGVVGLLGGGDKYDTIVVARAIADESDPEYEQIASKARTKKNFIAENIDSGDFKKINYSSNSLISFRCEDLNTIDEELIFLGIPIMNKTFVLMVILLIIVVSVVSSFKR